MDSMDINNLAKVIERYLSISSYRLGEVTNEISSELNGKNTSEILVEAKEHADNQPRNDKNIVIFIVVLALVIVNIDDTSKLKEKIEEQNLTGMLYGGMLIFLNGKTTKLSLNINYKNIPIRNDYQYIKNLLSLNDFRETILAEFFELLYHLNQDQFEEIIKVDQSNIILLLVARDDLVVNLSQNLKEDILEEENTKVNILKKMLILYIQSKPIVENLNRIKSAERQKRVFGVQNKENIIIEDLADSLSESIKCFDFYLEKMTTIEQVSFLIDFLLVHKDNFPVDFVVRLLSDNLFEDFINWYKENHDFFYEILQIFYCSQILEEYNLSNVKKEKLDSTLVFLQVKYINEFPSDLNWDEYGKLTKYLCENLSEKYSDDLEEELLEMKKELMSNGLDKLIRPAFYHDDFNRNYYIKEVLHVFDASTE